MVDQLKIAILLQKKEMENRQKKLKCEIYDKGVKDGYNQALEDFSSLLMDNLVDFGEGQNVIMAIDRGRIIKLKKQLDK